MTTHLAGAAFAIGLALAVNGCSHHDDHTAQSVAGKPHGDHDGAHGGLIIMDGENHVELVADASGRLAIWLSDGARDPRPASAASAVAVTLQPSAGAGRTISLARDRGDTHWAGTAGLISDPETTVTFSLSFPGRAPLAIDLTLTQLQAAARPATSHVAGDHRH